MNESDEVIASRASAGETEAFGVLVSRYEGKIRRYGRTFLSVREDIDDVVQEVFIKAFVNIKSFNAARRFSPWLYRIAHNEFVNALKKKSRQPFFSFDFSADTVLPHFIAAERSESAAEERLLRRAIEPCLNELPEKYREPLVLYYTEELSYGEIAEVLHLPVATVGVRIGRARGLLKKAYLQKYGTNLY